MRHRRSCDQGSRLSRCSSFAPSLMPERLADFVVKRGWRQTDVAPLPLVHLCQQMAISGPLLPCHHRIENPGEEVGIRLPAHVVRSSTHAESECTARDVPAVCAASFKPSSPTSCAPGVRQSDADVFQNRVAARAQALARCRRRCRHRGPSPRTAAACCISSCISPCRHPSRCHWSATTSANSRASFRSSLSA